MGKKFDFIINLLDKEIDRETGKAIRYYTRYNKLVLEPSNDKIKALRQAIDLLNEHNKSK